MAEYYPLETEIAVGMQRQLVGFQAQIQEWHERWEAILTHEQDRFAHVGMVRDHYLDRATNSLVEMREQKGLQETITDFTQALVGMQDAREWRDVEQSPEYQRWEAERNDPVTAEAIARAEDPEYQGWMAEQRYNEEMGEPFDYSYEAFQAAGEVGEEQGQESYEDVEGWTIDETREGLAVHPDAQATGVRTAELEALWERLDALEHGTDERQHQHEQGMGY